ncbi:MAG: helix-turn-helix domain-containing protein [Nanoarchaeota archaeon]|nr:helix-turn-helix domain-containing protein [Nanoarchaeota archaeon]MBU4124077.1 helix-turn-helix domain-containing protein [Nanoarchaeota archaeon]
MDRYLLDILNGTLLGDASILLSNYKYKKYFSFKLTAKDKSFLEWVDKQFKSFKITNSWISKDVRNNTHALYFYINSCPYPELIKLRSKWYIEREGMCMQKIIPKNLEITPIVLLHWYLGDGSLNRHKDDSRVPAIVLATNCFLDEDLDFLILKLKELNLNFYKVKYKSGFTGKECGYCLYSKTQDGTPFRFFKLIGFECPKEIRNYITGNKGPGAKIHYFRDKWPIEDEWIRIVSNVNGIGKIIKERRLKLNISRNEINDKLGTGNDYMRKIEYGVRFPRVEKLKKIMKILSIDSKYVLENLIPENFK